MKFFAISLFILSLCSSVALAKPDIREILASLDCRTYKFEKAHSSLTLKDKGAVWVFFNMGPSKLVILTKNDKGFRYVINNWGGESMPVFVGDTRYKYSVNLPKGANETILHVCLAPS